MRFGVYGAFDAEPPRSAPCPEPPSRPFASARRLPNRFDIAAVLCIAGLLFAFASGARQTVIPLNQVSEISLDPAYLPGYALRTTMRMAAALVCSLLFTFTYATWAAKSRRAGLVLVPLLDILQSVPIIGFLTFTVVFFMGLFPGRVLGVELAAIFAIFTSQAWNMAFSFYQSLKTVPADLAECATAFRLSPWQKFWRMEVPFAMPGLVWNTMMSVSGGWFFVVASEAVTVGSNTWKLPGIGSYVAEALEKRDIAAVFYAIGTMLLVILAYDQLLFRPLVAWSAKFRFEMTARAVAKDPWVLKLLRRTRVLAAGVDALVIGVQHRHRAAPVPCRRRAPRVRPRAIPRVGRRVGRAAGRSSRVGAVADRTVYVSHSLDWADLGEALLLGCYTMIRVVVLMVVATAVWVPIGVWLGLRPTWARRAQPVAQFLAAFPANLFFPIFVVAIVHWKPQPRYLADAADGAGRAVVHPVQRHRRRRRLSRGPAGGVEQLPHRRSAVVAPGRCCRGSSRTT